MARNFSKLMGILLVTILASVWPVLAGEDDGRVNPGSVEAAIYCTTQGVKIIDIDIRGVATGSFTVPYRAIGAVGIPEINTLIREHRGFRLYRLTTGELQLNAPANWRNSGEYVFIWDGCDPSTNIQP